MNLVFEIWIRVISKTFDWTRQKNKLNTTECKRNRKLESDVIPESAPTAKATTEIRADPIGLKF